MIRIRKSLIVLIMLEISLTAQSRLVLRHHFEKTQFLIGEQVGCIIELENVSDESIFIKELENFLHCEHSLFTEAGNVIRPKSTIYYGFGQNILLKNQKLIESKDISDLYGDQWGAFGILETGFYRLRSVYYSGFGDSASVESTFQVIEPQNIELQAYTELSKIVGFAKELRGQTINWELQRIGLKDFIENHSQSVYTPLALDILISQTETEERRLLSIRMCHEFPNYSIMFSTAAIRIVIDSKKTEIERNTEIELFHNKLTNEFVKQYFMNFIDYYYK